MNYNGTASFTVMPNTGYCISSVAGCGAGILNGSTYTTGPIISNCTVTASFVAGPCLITETVKPSGGNYTSLSACINSNKQNLVANNSILNCQIDGTWTNSDTTPIVINGYTTDATHYISIYTTSAARHSGVWNTTTAYRLEVSNDAAIWINSQYVRIDGLQVRVTSVNADGEEGVLVYYSGTGGDVRISNNIIRGVGSANSSYPYHNGIEVYNDTGASGTLKIWNNIVYDFQMTSGSHYMASCLHMSASGFTAYAYNNTTYGCNAGIYQNYSTVYAKNNIVQANLLKGFDGTFASGSDYNISDMTSAPGSHSKTSTTVSFVNVTNRNFHLSSSDTAARGAGINLTSDPNLSFSTDIDGDPRPSSGAWDIGADKY
jgi:hypothetical protein